MIMTNKEKDTVALYCNCGLGDGVLFEIDKHNDDIDGIDISLVSDVFYLIDLPWFERFKAKIKRVWRIIRNKEHCYFNIYVEAEDIKEFKEFVSQI